MPEAQAGSLFRGSWQHRLSWRYGLAAGAFAVSFAIRDGLDTWLVFDRGFTLFIPAVALTTLLAGAGPGILCALLSGVAVWYRFLPPFYSFSLDLDGAVGLATFAAVSAFSIGLIHWLRITNERLKAEQATTTTLAREREQLIEAKPNGVLVVDPAGRIRQTNARLADMFGYGRDELIGRPVEMLVPARFRHGHAALRAGFAARPATRPMGVGRDLYGLRKDGTEFPVEIGLSAFMASDGNLSLATVTDISVRKQSEEHQARLASIVESSRDAILGMSFDGIVTAWNPGAEALFGYSASEMIGQTIQRIIPAERVATEGQILDRLKAGQNVEHFETERITKQGERIPVSVTVSPIKDVTGRIIGASRIVRDISERRRTEHALAERARQQAALYWLVDRLHRADTLADIYDSALDTIRQALHCERASLLLYDETGVMRFVRWRGLSDAYREAVEGHSPWAREEADPQPVCIEDTDAADMPGLLRTAVIAENIRALAFIPIMAEGRLIGKFMSYYDKPHAFMADETDLALAIARQVGGSVLKKRADDALRQSEERFRMLADNMSQFCWMADAKGWIFWYNRRWFDYTGTTPEEMEGWGWTKVHHPDHLDRVIARLQHSWDTGEPWEDLFPLRGRDGTYRWFLSRALAIRDADGRIVRWFGTNTDVTEQRAGEELLKASLEDLRRFNRAAVGRELRMIELKQAINRLCRQHGQAERYPLDFERTGASG